MVIGHGWGQGDPAPPGEPVGAASWIWISSPPGLTFFMESRKGSQDILNPIIISNNLHFDPDRTPASQEAMT
jgi:hypothetical protein